MSIDKLDTANMNVSELQNVLYKLIKKAKNKRLLIHIIENIEEILEKHATETFWKRFTPEQRAELELSFEESFHEENLISFEEIKKKHEKWFK